MPETTNHTDSRSLGMVLSSRRLRWQPGKRSPFCNDGVDRLAFVVTRRTVQSSSGGWLYLLIPFLLMLDRRSLAVRLPAFYLIAIFQAVRRRSYLVFLLGLVIVSLILFLLSEFSPHFLRAIGLVIPIALIGGAGVWGVEELCRKVVNRPVKRSR